MLKVIGAIIIITTCGSLGVCVASGYLKELSLLKKTKGVLEYMQCELRCRLTPLPDLCADIAKTFGGIIGQVFSSLGCALENRSAPDVRECMDIALNGSVALPASVRNIFLELGRTLGRFDLVGQLEGIQHVCQLCEDGILQLSSNKKEYVHGCKTLGICAGAAIAILLI